MFQPCQSQIKDTISRCCQDDLMLRKEIILECRIDDLPAQDARRITIWLDHIDANCSTGIAEVVQTCSSFLGDESQLRSRLCIVFQHVASTGSLKSFVLIMETQRTTLSETDSYDIEHACDDIMHTAGALEFHRKANRTHVFLFLLVLLTFSIFLATPFVPNLFSRAGPRSPVKQWPEDGYIHYPTPNSIGPKRQDQLTYRNALEWVKSNPHDNGEWRVRMDDQAVIPAELWDEDEDYYQSWYYERYPHLRKIIQDRSFLRPNWLGSTKKVVEWDKEFHFNHCLIAFRRYWKAKESGRHVCPRDIDHNHIQHCLNWLDGKAFGPGGLNASMSPPVQDAMLWQTKVCY